MPGHVLRKRIARKILLGYVVPLAVLFVAGLIVPILFWSYLGRAGAEYDASVHASDRVNALGRAAQDVENSMRSYVRYGDDNFRLQFQDAHDTYRDNYRDIANFLTAHPDPSMSNSLDSVGTTYRYWRIHTALPTVREIEIHGAIPRLAAARSLKVAKKFEPVQVALNGIITQMDDMRSDLGIRAAQNNNLRLIIAIAVPTVAVLLAMLIARLNTLGITRPLEALTQAAETLEQGDLARVIVSEESMPYADDEIGDLQQAFRRMARTIGQREAILRTQNEALESLNRRVEAVLNATNDGIVMLDRGGGFSVVNERFAQLFGIEPDVLLDHTFVQAGPLFLSRFRHKDLVREKFQAILFDPEATTDEAYEIAEPRPRMLRMYSAPVRGGDSDDPELIGRIFVFRDVTRETAVDRMKTEFVSTVSHELRTPLTAIKGYVDLMVSGQTGPLTDVQKEFLLLVQTSTRRLTSLINDMLDISRIESGRIVLRRESVNYLPLVRQTLRMMTGEATARKITLNVEVVGVEAYKNEESYPSVYGDSDRITQVLVNLISNGIKYTPHGGTVTVQVEYEEDFVTTCVADTGIGINREDQSRLFQKFFRADNSTTREVGGTGLGLAITKAILEKLNGGIWVDSEPGQGSRFYFTLPTVDGNAEKTLTMEGDIPPDLDLIIPEQPVQAPPAPARKLVLSIDNDLGVLHRLGHALRESGYATSSAATPAEALRRARTLRPDIILMDPLMSEMDGFQMFQKLRAEMPETPIAILSTRAHDMQEPEIADNIAFLPRPFSSEEFYRLTDIALTKSDAETPSVLLIGDDSLEDLLVRYPHFQRGDDQLRLLTAATPEEAERLLSDPALSLVVLDTSVAPGNRAGRFVNAACRAPETCAIPYIVLTHAPLFSPQSAPIVAYGEGHVPLSELSSLLEAFLTVSVS